jgi:hypothetical protein
LYLATPRGVPAPRVLTLDLGRRTLRGNGWVVVRPCRDFGAGTGVEIVARESDLEATVERAQRGCGECVVSTYVPGPDSNMRSLTLLFDRSGNLISYFVLRKLAIWPPRTGIATLAVSAADVGLVDTVRPLFEHVGWVGPAEAELKIDELTGTPHLLEINPRLPGTVRFAIACGVDFPSRWCSIALGEHVEPRFGYATDRLWVNVSAFAKSLRAPRRAIRLLGEVRRRKWSALTFSFAGFDDPGYVLGKLLLEARALIAPFVAPGRRLRAATERDVRRPRL